MKESCTMMKTATNSTWLSLALALFATSCGGGSSGAAGTGHLRVFATDDPFALDIVKEAHVHVSAIRVHADSAAEDGFTTIYSGPGFDLSLLDLRNGVTFTAADTFLPVGSIGQIRIIIDDASLTLDNDNVYSTALGNLDLTSADTSGLKVFVSPPLEVVAGQTTDVLLDFDLSKTFHPVPASDPPNAAKFLLMPGIRTANLVDSGELRGVVTQDDGAGGEIGVDKATVYVLPPGETDLTLSVATSGSDPDGSYAILGVAPGTYDVIAAKGALQGTVTAVDIFAAESTTVDILIE